MSVLLSIVGAVLLIFGWGSLGLAGDQKAAGQPHAAYVWGGFALVVLAALVWRAA